MTRNVTYRFFVLALLILMAVRPPLAISQEWTWTTSQIDAEGTDSWVATDHDGNVHVSYRVQNGGKLKYAFLPAGGSRWFTMTLDQLLGDFLTQITVNRQGNPYICYTPGVLKLAVFDGQHWKTQEIDPGGGLVSFYCSVRIGKAGEPQLSWYVPSRYLLRHAVLQNGIWVARNVDAQDLPGKFNSLVIDDSGNPQLSYIGLYGTKLKYARFTGNDWIRTVLEGPTQGIERSRGDTGMGNSIALDRQGNPMISYFDTSSLKFARLVDGKWGFQVIDRFNNLDQWGWRFFRSITVLDRKGNPHIGYQSPLGLKHAWWDGHQWRTQVILAPTGVTFDGAMDMDGKDDLYFTYTDPVQRTLMLAIGHYSDDHRTATVESSQDQRKRP